MQISRVGSVGAGVREGSARRHHRVEERQRHGRAHAAEERPAGHLLSSDEVHVVSLRTFAFRSLFSIVTSAVRLGAFFIWNASLLITPRMNDDIL